MKQVESTWNQTLSGWSSIKIPSNTFNPIKFIKCKNTTIGCVTTNKHNSLSELSEQYQSKKTITTKDVNNSVIHEVGRSLKCFQLLEFTRQSGKRSVSFIDKNCNAISTLNVRPLAVHIQNKSDHCYNLKREFNKSTLLNKSDRENLRSCQVTASQNVGELKVLMEFLQQENTNTQRYDNHRFYKEQPSIDTPSQLNNQTISIRQNQLCEFPILINKCYDSKSFFLSKEIMQPQQIQAPYQLINQAIMKLGLKVKKVTSNKSFDKENLSLEKFTQKVSTQTTKIIQKPPSNFRKINHIRISGLINDLNQIEPQVQKKRDSQSCDNFVDEELNYFTNLKLKKQQIIKMEQNLKRKSLK